MSRRRVKWGQARRYFQRRGYEIVSRGGDKLIKAPAGKVPGSGRSVVRIGHKYCTRSSDELLPS